MMMPSDTSPHRVCIFSLLRCVQFAYFDTARLSSEYICPCWVDAIVTRVLASGNLETTRTFLENDISIICGCMPQLRPLLPGYLTGRAPSYGEDRVRVRHGRNDGGIFTWGRRVRGVETTITSNTIFSTRSQQHKVRNSSELELNAIEVETETTVTRSPDNGARPWYQKKHNLSINSMFISYHRVVPCALMFVNAA